MYLKFEPDLEAQLAHVIISFVEVSKRIMPAGPADGTGLLTRLKHSTA